MGLRNRLVVTLFPYDLGLNKLSIGNHTFTGQRSQPVTVVVNREAVVYFKFINNGPNVNAKGFVLCYKGKYHSIGKALNIQTVSPTKAKTLSLPPLSSKNREFLTPALADSLPRESE